MEQETGVPLALPDKQQSEPCASCSSTNGIKRPDPDYTRHFFVPEPRPMARIRLICFPYAGAWPWAFREWSAALSKEIEVATVCLPGRGRRAQDPPYTRMDALVKELSLAVETKVDRDYVFFGHSMGAIIAFELAAHFAELGVPAPMRIFVSASSAPSCRRPPRRLHEMPDPELISTIRSMNGTPAAILEDPEVLSMTLPLLRADCALIENHQSTAGAVNCAVTGLFGIADPFVDRSAVEGWRAHTRKEFILRGFRGGHFFIHDCAPEVLQCLQREIL